MAETPSKPHTHIAPFSVKWCMQRIRSQALAASITWEHPYAWQAQLACHFAHSTATVCRSVQIAWP